MPQNCEVNTLYKGIDTVLRLYNKAGFTIARIWCDNKFSTLSDDVMDDNNIALDCVPQGEHVPKAECNSRTIGERICATFHCLPHCMIPKVMLKTLAVFSCRQLNYFPAKNGVSEYFSLHMLMNCKNIDYNKHWKFTFGECVQAYQEEEKKNDNKRRTIDHIYLQPHFKSLGSHYIMNIATGARMHKKRLWSVPITQTVINAAKSVAKSQGYKALKLLGKNKTRLLPSDWDEDEEYLLDNSYDSDDSDNDDNADDNLDSCLLYTSPSPRD